MPVQTHYEVHVFQHGRWSIHAQFDSSQKDIAIEEGKTLDQQPGVDAVKVVREVYDSTEGTHRDYVVYKSADAPPSDNDEEAPAHESDDSGWDDEDEDGHDDFGGTFGGDQFSDGRKKKAKPKKKTTLTAFLIKILLVTLFSICLAALFTTVTASVLSGTTLFGVKIAGNAESNLLVIVFIATFLVCAVVMAMTFLSGETIEERNRKRAERHQKAAAAANKKRQQVAQKKRAKCLSGKFMSKRSIV